MEKMATGSIIIIITKGRWIAGKNIVGMKRVIEKKIMMMMLHKDTLVDEKGKKNLPRKARKKAKVEDVKDIKILAMMKNTPCIVQKIASPMRVIPMIKKESKIM